MALHLLEAIRVQKAEKRGPEAHAPSRNEFEDRPYRTVNVAG
jgi:hypothetical protein